MLSGAGNRHAVQKLKEIKIEHPEQRVRRALFWLQVAPFVESALCLTEDFINGFLRVQLLFEHFRVALVGQRKLIAQIEEAIVDRRCRKHQHFRLYAGAYDLAHQNLVAIFAVALMRTDAAFAIAKIMGLIDNDEVVVPPVQSVKVKPVRHTALARKVGMEKHIVVQAVCRNRIVDIIIFERVPVLG